MTVFTGAQEKDKLQRKFMMKESYGHFFSKSK